MPIDLKTALGGRLQTRDTSWTVDDVILYHLGIGAGANAPTETAALEYAYEKNLKVLPSFAVVPAGHSVGGVFSAPGIDIDYSLVLHVEQEIRLHRPIPVSAEVETTGRIAEIWDKRRAALIVAESTTRDKNGEDLFVNRVSLLARGEGGFGGEGGPRSSTRPPDRPPDLVLESSTTPQQALLYRLSGDKNPLHAEPEVAHKAGFERPILHGLCSFGVALRAVVDEALDGDVEAVSAYRARFSGVVYPGETIVTSLWREDGQIRLTAKTAERGSPVLSNSVIQLL